MQNIFKPTKGCEVITGVLCQKNTETQQK